MNTANKITVARILMTPVFMALFLAGNYWCSVAAGVVFLLAALTDKLDGHIARKYDQISTLGKFLDPLADKLLVLAALICMVEKGLAASYLVVIIVARELVVTSFRIIAMGKGVTLAADIWGKIKTVLQMAAVLCLLVEWIIWPGSYLIGTVVLWIATGVTILSGVNYIYKNREVLK